MADGDALRADHLAGMVSDGTALVTLLLDAYNDHDIGR
jgi:hypothetical protein